MHRISNGTQVSTLPVPAPVIGTPGFASPGIVGSFFPTDIDPDAFNAHQEELMAFLEEAGIDQSKTDNGQVLQAIKELFATLVAPQFSADGTDVPTTPTPDGSNPLQIANIGSVLSAILAGAGLGNSLGANGYQVLPGGLILQWGKTASGANGNSQVDFPIPFPHACFGVWAIESNAGGSWPNQNVTLHGVSNGPPANQFVMYSVQFNNPSAGLWTGVPGLGYYWISLGY